MKEATGGQRRPHWNHTFIIEYKEQSGRGLRVKYWMSDVCQQNDVRGGRKNEKMTFLRNTSNKLKKKVVRWMNIIFVRRFETQNGTGREYEV